MFDIHNSSATLDTASNLDENFLPSRISVSLPTFSRKVIIGLKSNNVMPVFNQLVEEAAQHVLKLGEGLFTKKGQYKAFGEALYRRYPSIGFRDAGPNPWSFFTKKLSQKVRTTRFFSRKRCPQDPVDANVQFTTTGTEDDNAEVLEEKLKEELAKTKPDMFLVRNIFEKMHDKRRNDIHSCTGLTPSSLVIKHPLLKDMDFILWELLLIQNQNMEALLQNYTRMMNIIGVMKSGSGSQGGELDGINEELDKIIWLQTAITDGRNDKRQAASKWQAVQVFEADEAGNKLGSTKNSPPRLMITRHGSSLLLQAWIIGDGMCISCPQKEKAIFGFIISLMAAYYAWDLVYPKNFQILGFFQLHLLCDKSHDFMKSTRFVRLEKTVQEQQNAN